MKNVNASALGIIPEPWPTSTTKRLPLKGLGALTLGADRSRLLRED